MGKTAINKTEKSPRGRPCSFDRDEMLEKIMHLFWEYGYGGLSFNEISKETGLTRASLYNTFKTKDDLFLEALQHYLKNAPDSILANVGENQSIAETFYSVLNNACKARSEDKKRLGCLAINCIDEMMSSDTPLGNHLALMYDKQQALIERLMKQAIAQKELPQNTNPKITANLILVFISGLSTFSKKESDEEALRAMCHSFLSQIGFKST